MYSSDNVLHLSRHFLSTRSADIWIGLSQMTDFGETLIPKTTLLNSIYAVRLGLWQASCSPLALPYAYVQLTLELSELGVRLLCGVLG